MSLHEDCLAAAELILLGLPLDGGLNRRVVRQLLEDESNAAYPYLRLKVEGLAEQSAPLTSAHRLVQLPVQVDVMQRSGGPAPEALPGWLGWREAVREAFPERRLPTYPPGVHACRVAPGAVAEADTAGSQLVAGRLVVWFLAVRPVGV
jgi:hypothetical protein